MSRIRVTGGQWRSRLIQVPESQGLRPTPDRVRETLFNWLGHDLSGNSCLDLFAGSGILGIEAASRGARPVYFVERDAKVRMVLRQQLQAFDPAAEGSSGSPFRLHPGDALNFVPPEPVDVLFLDPPYRQGLLEKLAPRLTQLVKPDGLIYAEAESPLTELDQWRVIKQGHAGQVFYHLLEHA
jgi:16S rRNA (guanine(966)-N(2))-methyltransferase RsmD